MGWLSRLRDFFREMDNPDYDKMFRDRMAKEQKEKEAIFDFRENIGLINRIVATDKVKYKRSKEAEQKKETKEENKKEEKAEDGFKMVIDGAKLQCTLCTNPVGDLKVNFDTPTTQDKKTATVKEKDMKSLIFKGNCKKSPQSSSPCASVMQLGGWKNVGTSKIQEQFPLLLKSTIKCNYGGVDIKITDCGQRSEPEDVSPANKGLKKKKILSAKWMCAEMQEDIQKAHVGQKVSILVKTRNYDEGETVTIIVDDKNGYDAKEGEKEITFTGEVQADGFAELKEQIAIEDVAENPKHKTDKQLEREEAEKTEIYITREGKDYTRAEWKAYQDKWHDDMMAAKKKGFWG